LGTETCEPSSRRKRTSGKKCSRSWSAWDSPITPSSRKEDQHKIGTCGLYDREGLAGVDIGFALLPDYEGQGYAFEAAHRLQELAFSEFGLSSIQAITTKDNLASQRLLEKLGLQRTGTTRIPNDPEELWLYKIKKP
jgi:ribosomal-protein-alanine N-acetyltransferase